MPNHRSPTPSVWKFAQPKSFVLANISFSVWWVPPEVVVPGTLTGEELSDSKVRSEGPVLESWRRTRRAVRAISGGMSGIDPAEVQVDRSDLGKPRLVNSDLEVSVSHSADHIVVAVGRRPVGVDIEIFGRERLSLEVAQRYFPPAEAEWLQKLPPTELDRCFLRLWVSKEAALKCLGTGLAGYLERTHCEHDATGAVSSVEIDGRKFAIREFDLGRAGIGALAVEAEFPEATLLKAVF